MIVFGKVVSVVKALKGAGLLKIGGDSGAPAAAVASAPSKPGRVKASKVRRYSTTLLVLLAYQVVRPGTDDDLDYDL